MPTFFAFFAFIGAYTEAVRFTYFGVVIPAKAPVAAEIEVLAFRFVEEVDSALDCSQHDRQTNQIE